MSYVLLFFICCILSVCLKVIHLKILELSPSTPPHVVGDLGIDGSKKKITWEILQLVESFPILMYIYISYNLYIYSQHIFVNIMMWILPNFNQTPRKKKSAVLVVWRICDLFISTPKLWNIHQLFLTFSKLMVLFCRGPVWIKPGWAPRGPNSASWGTSGDA